MPEWLPGAAILVVLVANVFIRVPATIRANIMVQSSVDECFTFVATPTNTPKWNPRVKSVTITEGQVGVGTKYQLHLEVAGARGTLPYEVVEYQPPMLFAAETKIRTKIRRTTNRFEYSFESTDAGTRITAASQLRVPLVQALVIRIIGASPTKRNLALMKAAIDGAAKGHSSI
jgi:hypothetical protein